MSTRMTGDRLVQALIARGLVPQNCRRAEVQIAVDGVLSLVYEVLVTDVDLAALGDAFREAAEPRRIIAPVQDARESVEGICDLCGEPMPPGEEMFKFHGFSGPCPPKTP